MLNVLDWMGLFAAAVAGLAAGAYVNWAVYGLAWNRRSISPWSAPHVDAPPRRPSDRLPVIGWLGLRRETAIHGARFWRRPLAVELFMAAAWVALYWHEVVQQGLLHAQFEALAGGALSRDFLVAPCWTTLAGFASHALLMTLMAAASLIDLDEKTIPDGVTTPGTLLALALAAVAPMSLLPHAEELAQPPALGAVVPFPPGVQAQGGALYVEPLLLTMPNPWPDALNGGLGLSIGLAAFTLWWVALAPRMMRWRRGMFFGLRVLWARALRELLRPRSAAIGLIGWGAIVAVWLRGGGAWLGLLTALVGMIGGGAMIWAVRIVGSAALRKEAMGFGDVTLMMMIGSFLGWQPTIFIFFLAPFAGLLAGLSQLALRRDDVIPYGPFLCLATMVVIVWWGRFWNQNPHGFQAIFQLGWLIPAVLGVGIVMLGAMLVLWRNVKERLWGAED